MSWKKDKEVLCCAKQSLAIHCMARTGGIFIFENFGAVNKTGEYLKSFQTSARSQKGLSLLIGSKRGPVRKFEALAGAARRLQPRIVARIRKLLYTSQKRRFELSREAERRFARPCR